MIEVNINPYQLKWVIVNSLSLIFTLQASRKPGQDSLLLWGSLADPPGMDFWGMHFAEKLIF